MSKIVEFPEDRDGRDHASVKAAVLRVLDAYGQPGAGSPFRTYEKGDLRLSLDEETGATDVTFRGQVVFSDSHSSGMCDPAEGTDREGWLEQLHVIVDSIAARIDDNHTSSAAEG